MSMWGCRHGGCGGGGGLASAYGGATPASATSGYTSPPGGATCSHDHRARADAHVCAAFMRCLSWAT